MLKLIAKIYYKMPMRVKRFCSRKRLFVLYRPIKKYAIAEVGGVKFEIDKRTYVGSCLFNLKKYEEDTYNFMKQHLHNGCIAVDVGASIGAHALRMGALVQPKGRVYAFEPSRFLIEQLKRNIALNSSLIEALFPINKGVSDKNGEAFLSMEQLGRLDGSPLHQPKEKVPLVSLDNFFSEFPIQRLDFIKIDTDGAEPEILQGALQTLEKHRPAISIETRERTAENIYNTLSQLGYLIHNEKMQLQTLEEVKKMKRVQNLFCIHGEKK